MAQVVQSAFSVEGSGPPLFLIHGVGASRHSWDGLIEHLRSSYRCISYDLRGHGRTPKLSLPSSLEDFVEDLEALRRELGIERAHFAGHSLGGMIAPAYAHRYGERVRSLSLFSTAAFRSAEERSKLRQFVETMRTEGLGAVLETLKERWFTPEFAARQPDAIERRMQQLRAMDPQVYIATFSVYAESETGAWLPSMQQPTLLLTGECDLTCGPRPNRAMAAALPHAELQILPHLRHSILMEAPDQVAPPLLAFLQRQPRA
jgi:pimeloyl-ACP methyl ester carboxylesterase